MESDPREVAMIKLKEMLRHPEDLENKIGNIKKRMIQEKAQLDAQLRAGAQAQYDEINAGIDLLDSVNANTENLMHRLKNVMAVREPSEQLAENFGLIVEISRLYANAMKTRKMVRQFTTLDDKLDEIEEIAEQQKREGRISPANLLRLHYKLSQLEEFRDEVMLNSQNASDEAIQQVDRYFSRLDNLSDYFSEFFWGIVRNLFDYATSDEEGPLIVSIGKIVEAEERADEKALQMWRADVANEELDEATDGPSPKAFKNRLFEVIAEIIQDRFQLWLEQFDDDIFNSLDATAFVFDDLDCVANYVVPRFPKSWNVFPYITSEYHAQLNNIVTQIAATDLDAGQILRLLRWAREYYSDMKKQLGVAEKSLEPKLLEGQEETLIKDYLQLVRTKVDEWMANLTRTVQTEFAERINPPEQDADNKYGMSVAVIVFQVINQQVDLATEANRGQLLCDVVEQCTGSLKTTQDAWRSLMKFEVDAQLSGEDVPGGIVEYLMAFANEQLRCVEFCDAIVERLSGMLSNKYSMAVGKSFDDALAGFLETATVASNHLVDIAFNDMVSVYTALFCSEWYTEEHIILVVETLRDYCQDFHSAMKDFLFSRLMQSIMERHIVEYMSAMQNKDAVFRMPQCKNRLKVDTEMAMTFFAEFIEDEQQLKDAFDPLVRLNAFLVASPDNLYLEFHNLRKRYWDFNPNFAEIILGKREDLDKEKLKEVMENIRSKMDDIKVKTDAPSVFSKLK